jgi:threonine/homoserine efflux transporter RhtA
LWTDSARHTIASYSQLESITGISLAHSDGNIIAYHIHEGDEFNTLDYEVGSEVATWIHCPIGASETIEAIWYAVYNIGGAGLVVGVCQS